jgi:hypothetical protein
LRIPPVLLEDLALLTEALDGSAVDIGVTVSLLMSDAARAVPSYVALSIRMSLLDMQTEVTTLEDDEQVARVKSSLRFRLPGRSSPGLIGRPSIDIVLLASRSGAFVDLAADLAWLTQQPLDEFVLDADLPESRPLAPNVSLRGLSSINQAIGVLMSEGSSPEEASRMLDELAAESGVERHHAAAGILAGDLPRVGDPDPDGSAELAKP